MLSSLIENIVRDREIVAIKDLHKSGKFSSLKEAKEEVKILKTLLDGYLLFPDHGICDMCKYNCISEYCIRSFCKKFTLDEEYLEKFKRFCWENYKVNLEDRYFQETGGQKYE